jgi:hypothetical protein
MLTLGHLDVSGDKPRPESPISSGLHHKDREVAARPAAAHECLVGQLNALRVTGIILKRSIDVGVQIVQEIKSVDKLSWLVQIAQPSEQSGVIIWITG